MSKAKGPSLKALIASFSYLDVLRESGVTLWTVEVAFGDRPFEITDSDHPCHLQLRSWDIIWHKENALYLLASRLPADWETLCWIDADVEFTARHGARNWVQETWHALQQYMVVQMFSHCIDLGPNGEHIQSHQGFNYAYLQGKPRGKCYTHWHPGYAWACRREAWDHMGGLIDTAILGSADHHMAAAWIGVAEETIHDQSSPAFMKPIKIFQERCERHLRRDVGYVPGTILHAWHGKKKDRRYIERWKGLVDHKFDPYTDLKRDFQGLWQYHDDGSLRSIKLRDYIRQYMAARNEDSVDLE